MNAEDIIEVFGRGIPATLDTAMIVDVCAYLRSTKSPVALVLTGRGETRGVLSQRDIVHSSGRLGSSVMQMIAGELVREQAPVCQKATSMIEVLELLTETNNDFVLVCDGSTIQGVITLHDVAELLMQALGGEDSAAAEPEQAAPEAVEAQQVQAQPAQQAIADIPQLAPAQPGLEQPAWQPAPVVPASDQLHQFVSAPAAAHPVVQAPQEPQPAAQQVPVYAAAPEVPAAAAFAPVQQPPYQHAAPQQTAVQQQQQPQQAAPVQQGRASFST